MIRISLTLLLTGFLFSASGADRVPAYGRVLTHVNGNVTMTQKNGNSNKVIEETRDKNNRLLLVREYFLDSQQRFISGIIYDAHRNPLGSMFYLYDDRTGQQLEERLFDKQGRCIRRLFYPGALKDPRFARRIVAFTPNNQNQWFEDATSKPKPIRPMVEEGDQDRFEPGMYSGKGVPVTTKGSEAASLPELPPASKAATPRPGAAPAAAPVKKPTRSFLPQKK